MAVRLEKVFGTPACEWLIRQRDYKLVEIMSWANEIKVEPFHAPTTERQGKA